MSTKRIPAGKEPSRRKRRPAEEIKANLLEATRVEFNLVGFAATTAAIAVRADVTEGQLYRHFGSKQELLRQAVFKPLDRALADFAAEYLAKIAFLDDRKERITLYIRSLQDFVVDHPELITTLVGLRSSVANEQIATQELSSISSYFDIGTRLLKQRDSVNPRISARFMSKFIFASILSSLLFKDWLVAGDAESDDYLIDSVSDFLIDAVYASVTDKEPGP